MTTYILTGGRDRVHPEYGPKLAAELKKHYERFKILSCFFAGSEETWAMMAEKWQPWFEERLGSMEKYDYARAGTFAEQLKDFDILYLHGGPNRPLANALDMYGDVQQLFGGKVVVGSSAGANYVAKNFWGSGSQKPYKGKGLLDINIMVHYGAPNHEGNIRTPEDWDREEKEFREFLGTDEKIWHLPEGEIEVFEGGIA